MHEITTNDSPQRGSAAPVCRLCGEKAELNGDDVCFDCWGGDAYKARLAEAARAAERPATYPLGFAEYEFNYDRERRPQTRETTTPEPTPILVAPDAAPVLSREEKERRRDDAAQAAEGLVYGVGRFEPTYTGDMSAAAAFATLAAYWQARIEWEHGVGY